MKTFSTDFPETATLIKLKNKLQIEQFEQLLAIAQPIPTTNVNLDVRAKIIVTQYHSVDTICASPLYFTYKEHTYQMSNEMRTFIWQD